MSDVWREAPTLRGVLAATETRWISPKKKSFSTVIGGLPVKPGEVDNAAGSLDRFAPLLRRLLL
ncbi:hypothetical protein [Oscillibacter sp.]|uniref:hypothetical protein n=1 Tax=Oscillibacter sp. TaxID=1945593 RepID=UPI0028AB365D|nr:hypothetical protein [Oscillibacter sp.]